MPDDDREHIVQRAVATDDHDGVDPGLDGLGELFAGVLGIVALDAGDVVPERAQQMLGVVAMRSPCRLPETGLTTSATCMGPA